METNAPQYVINSNSVKNVQVATQKLGKYLFHKSEFQGSSSGELLGPNENKNGSRFHSNLSAGRFAMNSTIGLKKALII